MAKKKAKVAETCPTPSSCCSSCCWGCKIVVAVIALLYLATDMGWITWWKLNWWTVAFILVALHKFLKK